ncbi:class I SAM-dependent methyltransferase [Jannaschia pohangensis]|uniref:SAM-dependent methyltransferase n=1 Tax=Jannaschia pohangensis TaxID=390807 RepID=A0A1I3GNJ8_9RHOB|nr:class I SAM-dependent methyltransferase [Jannaschia pohangensis]SFI25055.1 SAM-dependent methyltransferase [Jannaschia pohangensis]
MSAFWTIHTGLLREGPGTPAEVAWACGHADIPLAGRICDVGCGPGADLATLRRAVPEGSVLGLDRHLPFVVDAALRHRDDPGIAVKRGLLVARDGLPDPASEGPFDLIWCAGAIYFEGVTAALQAWGPALTARGCVAFSTPVVADPDDAEAVAFWGGDLWDTDATLDAAIAEAGFETIALGQVDDTGWEAYYAATEARCAELDAVADAELRAAVAETRAEASDWRRLRGRLGYALRVVRPA